MTTVTQWFDGGVKPAHIGPYQRKYEDGDPNDVGVKFPDFWDGENWFLTNCNGDFVSASKVKFPWRGLSEKPQEPAK